MVKRKKILIAQGGGPTVVINQSLIGVIEEAYKINADVVGAYNGVSGIVNSNFVSLSKLTTKQRKLISNTPSAFLGSTRDKPDQSYCDEIFKVLKKKNVGKFFYIGGNDSSDSLRIISETAKRKDYELQCIHIPKTIDNDLVLNDHTPGFGSAAKFVASAFSGINLDVKSLPGIYVGVVMGRHAGFLTASSCLLKKGNYDGPHLIYIPEVNFDTNIFLKDVNKIYQKLGRCVIAVSEGIKDKNNKLIANYMIKNLEKDAHGNVQLSGTSCVGDFLVHEIKNKLKVKRVRSDTFGYLQRSFLGCNSEVDEREAKTLGKKAFIFSKNNKSSFSVSIKERKNLSLNYKITFGINKLKDVAAKTKLMPRNFMNQKGNHVTNNFLRYAKPLIGKKIPEFLTSF